MANPLREFGTTAKALSANPLGIIALFIVLVYGLASLVVITGGSLTPSERTPIIYFLVVFPVIVLGVFTFLVAFRSGQLFAPGDFKREETYLELQRMRYAAVASLAVAKQTRLGSHNWLDDAAINNVVESVQSASSLAEEGASNTLVLWVDDTHRNNSLERKAFTAFGIDFKLAETTQQALQLTSDMSFGATISDMGRREGPREGYVLLDALRARGDKTPLFFYASSSAEEHRRETREHGGQGCTNDGQELFDMVTASIFGASAGSQR